MSHNVRSCRGFELFAFPAALLTFTYPVYAAFFAGAAYVLWSRAYFYEMSRRLVTRLDILPDLEMISVERVAPFGVLHNKLIKISDLEYVPYSALESENWFWAS